MSFLAQADAKGYINAMTWMEVCEDKRLQDLPYKVELNRRGQIIMSPTRFKHGFYQAQIALALKKLLPQGYVTTECAVDTPEGTKVADTTWSSPERFKVNEHAFSCSVAPEICVEVLSPANDLTEMTAKRDLYFLKGAQEYWLCDQVGAMRFFNRSGELARSVMCPEFPLRIEA